MTTLLRLAISLWILVVLVQAARAAWRHRDLTGLIWRSIRPRHVAGAVALLAVVTATAAVLVVAVPPLRIGLGHLIGFTGNAVFVPLEEAVRATGPVPVNGPDWGALGVSSVFLGLLLVLLPWLAFVEEEIFRAGLETASRWQQARAALVFGLVHLVMLVPVGAALAIAVAGAVYGRIYRRAWHRDDGRAVPRPVARAFRPTRRSAAAAAQVRAHATQPLQSERQPRAGSAEAEVAVRSDPRPELRQANAVLESAVWHTTFNSMIVVLVWVAIAYEALAR